LNSRLDELQAAVLRVRLGYLRGENELRRQIAARFTESIGQKDMIAPASVPGTLHAMHLYVVQVSERELLRSFMMDRGIHTALHYPLPVHLQPAFTEARKTRAGLKETDKLVGKIVTLPLYPELEEPDVERICDALNHWDVCF
jgi:dTDP-4-amino-4,6-dideoxygalactose transaminase